MIQNLFTPNVLYALAALVLAFVISYCGTPLAGKLARRCNCYDIPDGKRKLHAYPVPYFGGLAILMGFSVTLPLFSLMFMGILASEILVMVIGGVMICLVGLIDDMFGMRPIVKFLCQILIAFFTAVFGFTIDYVTLFGHTVRFGFFAVPLTVLWIVMIINAVNLIDGLDGLAGSVSVLESFALLITALLMGNPVCAVASAALCGAALGFLPFNFGRATIFMGDAGSMFIGYVMACISVSGLFKAQALFSIVVPAMIFALPMIDAVMAFFRRVMHGQSPFAADHKHLHYILLENGFTPRQSVIALLMASALFCVASVIYVRFKVVSLVMFAVSIAFLVILKHDKHFLERFKKKTVLKNTVQNTNETV